MFKKFLLLSLLSLTLIFSQTVIASTPVDGKIFYKLPNDNLVTRQVTLEVPARGMGEVRLSGQNFEWSTTNFKTTTAHGQTIFEATFNVEWMGETSELKLIGTYIQAKNKILYYGDIYKTKDQDFRHIGGFVFNFNRQN